MKKIVGFLAVLVFTLPAVWWFFGPGYYNMHDDLQVMRVVEIEKCLQDGQIPCRWVPDMAWGYGQAMLNFYSAFPYYLGAIGRILTSLSIIGTVKMLFVIAFIGAAIGMYFLAKELWGTWGGVVASVLYTYAPYHALDIYVRGALAESYSLAILPFLWFYIYRLVKVPKTSNIIGVALSLAALLTTHNISTMIYTLPTLFWAFFWIIFTRNWKSILFLSVSGVLGIGLASFFLIPAVYEQSLIKIEYLTQGYSDYHAHFVTLRQLFLNRSWGDGPSIFGDTDNISFQIGWPLWWLTVPSSLLALYFLYKKKISTSFLIIALVGLGFFSAFLTHPRSLFIWEKLPKIKFVQFPWRFLGLTIFFFSLSGGVITMIKNNLKVLIGIFLIALTISLNKDYFIPVHFSRLVKDQEKLQGVAWELQQKSAILDYLPKTAKIEPQSVAFSEPKFIEGDGVIKNFDKASNRFSFDAEVYNASEIEIPVMFFPGWTLIVDGTEIPISIHGDYGLIKVVLDQGNHMILGRFINTPVRSIGNAISLISGSVLFTLSIIGKKKDEK